MGKKFRANHYIMDGGYSLTGTDPRTHYPFQQSEMARRDLQHIRYPCSGYFMMQSETSP